MPSYIPYGSGKQYRKKTGPKKPGPRSKTPVGQWRKTVRSIRGELRDVEVRRLRDGREQVRVLYPKNRSLKEFKSLFK